MFEKIANVRFNVHVLFIYHTLNSEFGLATEIASR